MNYGQVMSRGGGFRDSVSSGNTMSEAARARVQAKVLGLTSHKYCDWKLGPQATARSFRRHDAVNLGHAKITLCSPPSF
eukprot:4819968-Pleurochrysis_carterae.AAC.1